MTAIAACIICPVTLFFPVQKKVCQNDLKMLQIYLSTLCESFKNLLWTLFPFWWLKIEKWACINLYKSSLLTQDFLFVKIIFMWIFFADTNFVIFRVDFFSMKSEYIWSLIIMIPSLELKSRFQQPVYKNFSVKICIK